jgi:drug/metabolite transporter (DMT)-like permease
VALGYCVFDEPLTPAFWLGRAVIVSSGRFVMWRRTPPSRGRDLQR